MNYNIPKEQMEAVLNFNKFTKTDKRGRPKNSLDILPRLVKMEISAESKKA